MTYDDYPPSRPGRPPRPEWDDEFPGGREPSGSWNDDEPSPPPRASGRASVGGPAVGSTPVGRPPTGRASVPGAVSPAGPGGRVDPYGSSGRVDPYGPSGGRVDPYGPSGGRGSHTDYDHDEFDPVPGTGRGPGGPGPMGPGPMGPGPMGPGPGMPGRANAGRASVRPISPGGPGGYGPPGPGGTGGPGGPNGPGGPGGRGPRGPFGPGPGEDGDDEGTGGWADRFRRRIRGKDDGHTPEQTKRKRARRRNLIIAGFATFIMLAGVGVVGGTYYVDNVKFTQDELTFPETTQILYNDGSLLAKLGETTRYALKYDEMSDVVKQSIVASEDKTFWTNTGVDFTGVLRAAWNNFTGGETQGGSTITQQYARLAFELSGSTYSRKLREAVLAWKISDKLSKEQILEYYLNSVPFGRNTYGIEAAAQAFFGKTAKKTADPKQQITVSEAMLLVLMVKQPNPDPDDPEGSPGYDPTYNKKAEEQARARWDYVHGQMIELGYLKATDKVDFPTTVIKYDPKVSNGTDKPAGLIVHHVLSELSNSPGRFHGWKWDAIEKGGFRIYTTLDKRAQAAAEAAADETVAKSVMNGQPATLQAALVAVEPGTGRVLAYYGGHDGNGVDYAGVYLEDDGKTWAGYGAHPPGSSFKVYTLAAALNAGISLNSYWQWTPHDMPGRVGPDKQVRNASNCVSDMDNSVRPPVPRSGICSLLESTTASLNTTFYAVTLSVGTSKVLDMARNAGIDHMWSDHGRIDFTPTTDMSKQAGNNFDIIAGIGQYPVTVADHANGLATFAAGGLRAQEHYVLKVIDKDETKPVYGETLPAPNQPTIIKPNVSADLTYALTTVTASNLGNGWPTAGKTGSWEANGSVTDNAHAWMTGYTKKLAAAVWVGNKKDEKPIKNKNGGTVWGSGLPTDIWRQFMVNAETAMGFKNDASVKFAPKAGIGIENPPYSVPSPTPPAPTDTPQNLPTSPGGTGGTGGPGHGGVVFPMPTTTTATTTRRSSGSG